jgi:hypothetical protein
MTELNPKQRGYTDTGFMIVEYTPECIILMPESNPKHSIITSCAAIGKGVQKQRWIMLSMRGS